MSSFDLIKILRDKIGEVPAVALTNYIDGQVTEIKEESINKNDIATKQDITLVKKDISDLSEKLTDKINAQLKWIIGLIIGQMTFVLALVYFVLNFKK